MCNSVHFYYIVSAYKLGCCKKNMFDSDRYVGPGSIPSQIQTRSEFKRQIIKINTTTRDMLTFIAPQI